MARNKRKLSWIPDKTARRRAFIKRRECLLKKVSEISTLCDVKACAIVYGPEDSGPVAWPRAAEAKSMIQSFLQYETRELELALLMHEFMSGRGMNGLSKTDAAALFCFAERKSKVVHDLMEAAKKEEGSSSQNPSGSVEQPHHSL